MNLILYDFYEQEAAIPSSRFYALIGHDYEHPTGPVEIPVWLTLAREE